MDDSEKTAAQGLADFEAFAAKVKPELAEKVLQDLSAMVTEGKSWAEVFQVPRQALFDLAHHAYLKFQGGRLEEAESVFKGLTLYDPEVAYFHTALGAIHQKQKRYLDALAEYSLALDLEPQDLTALCNRAEILLECEGAQYAAEDLKKIFKLDPEAKSPWTKRAKLLEKKLSLVQTKA